MLPQDVCKLGGSVCSPPIPLMQAASSCWLPQTPYNNVLGQKDY